METQNKIKTGANSTFAISGVSCSADSLVVAESFVLRINFCAKNPPHRQAEKRQTVKKPQKVFVIWNKFHIYAR